MPFLNKVLAGILNDRKRLLILAAVPLLYFVFTFGLSTNPPGFYIDESCIAYNGYLIATTGVAENGTSFPLYFQCYTQGYSQYMSAGQPYALALMYFFIAPSTISARMFAATTLFLAILLLGFMAARISGRRAVGVIVVLSGLATPWIYEYSRLVMETFFTMFCVVLFLFFLYNAHRKSKWTIVDNFLIAVSLMLITYSYASGRAIAPLFAFGLLIFAVNKRGLFDVFKTWVLYALMMIPIIVVYYTKPLVVSGRFLAATNLSKDRSIFANVWTVITAIYEDLSLKYFIFDGEAYIRHHVPGIGEFLVGTFALGVCGLVIILIKHRSSLWWRFVLFGSVVALVPGAITKDRHDSMRDLAFPIFFLLFTVPAISWLVGVYAEKRAESTLADPDHDTSASIDRLRSPKAGFFGDPKVQHYLRLGLLAGLLLITGVQLVQFQKLYWTFGTSKPRQDVFCEAYPRILDAALADGSRPIYLRDGGEPAYMHAFWYGAIRGVDRSNFVHLLDWHVPPAGALVLSANTECKNCEEISRDGGYLLYRTRPEATTAATPIPADPIPADPVPVIAPVVFTADTGAGPGQLFNPSGITADAAGNFYIADSGNSRVQKFDADGKFQMEIGRGGQLRDPSCVAIDDAGAIYVIDRNVNKLMKFNSDGSFSAGFGGLDAGFGGVRDMLFATNDQLYLVDQSRSRIIRFDPVSSTFSLIWGTRGSGEGNFIEPTGISMGDNVLYVADSGNARVQVFDFEGKFVRQINITTWEKSLEEYPDIAFDHLTNKLYITSGKQNEVLTFDVKDNQFNKLRLQGGKKLNNPSSLIISEANNKKRLIIVNTGNSKVTAIELGTGNGQSKN